MIGRRERDKTRGARERTPDLKCYTRPQQKCCHAQIHRVAADLIQAISDQSAGLVHRIRQVDDFGPIETLEGK